MFRVILGLFVCTSLFGNGHIRVLLAQGEVTQPIEWQFITSKKSFLCAFSEGSLFCNGKRLPKNALRISTDDNRCAYQDAAYAGDIALIIQDNHWYIINNLLLDDYVYSVLRSESWPGWPLEVNKVFAIMVRTYAVHKIMVAKNQKKRPLFDIRATNKGVHDFEHLRQAVNDTHDIIITYNKQPIVAMYDSCCGGVIPAQLSGFDFKSNPYLARPYACIYCSECKLFNWSFTYPHDTLLNLLQKEFPDIKQIKDIRVTASDKAGKALEISVVSGKTSKVHKTITASAMYRLCKDVRSFCYTIKKEGKDFIFAGKGFGHHMGVCQWGVRTMAKKGFLCKEILDYYYPGTTLMKLVTEPHHAAA
jgi:stage II sporulation protein D